MTNPHADESADQHPFETNDIAQHVYQLYKSGVPFYTKKAMQEISDQLSKVKDTGSSTVTLPRLDGKTYEIGLLQSIQTPEQLRNNPLPGVASEILQSADDLNEKPGKRDDTDERGLVNPHIRYHSVDGMVSYIDPLLSYLPFTICYHTAFRDAATGESTYYRRMNPMPYDELSRNFHAQRAKWESSEGRKQFAKIVAPTKAIPVRKVVAFACGPLFFEEFATRSALQHALILTLRDIFGQHVKCFAQDPYYFPDDKKILENEGVQVADDPQGFLELDDDSAVISCAPDIPVSSIVCEIARPALMIMFDKDKCVNDWEWPSAGPRYTDPTTPRVRDFLVNHYIKIPFPHTEDGYPGDTLAMYIRKSE